MKYWKILVCLSLPYLLLGCCKCADYITITQNNYCSINANPIDSFDNEDDAVSSADTIAKNNFGLRVSIETSEGLCQKPTSIFTSAYACKCPEPYQNAPTVAIKEIRIRTLNDFDNTHQAGDIITEYFEQFYGPIYKSIDQFSLNFKDRKYDGREELLLGSFDIRLMKEPLNPSKQSFEVEIVLADDRIITAITREVYLN